MYEKLSKCWKSLDRNVIVNQRELILGLAVCALTGVLAGIALASRKSLTIGSYNGNGTFPPEAPEDSGQEAISGAEGE